jgi:P-type Ca2+ transporter type 2B
MLSGTSIMKGTGAMIVTSVGLFSEEGIIQKLITGVGADEVKLGELTMQHLTSYLTSYLHLLFLWPS